MHYASSRLEVRDARLKHERDEILEEALCRSYTCRRTVLKNGGEIDAVVRRGARLVHGDARRALLGWVVPEQTP